MNVKRFIGRNSREAMQKVKAALGDEAIVLSTKPAAEGGIEILAMGAEGMAAVESMSSSAGRAPARDHRDHRDHREPQGQRQDDADSAEPADEAAAVSGRSVSQAVSDSVSQLAHHVQEDVKSLAMSTLSFQDYVRERMLKRRQAAIQRGAADMHLPEQGHAAVVGGEVQQAGEGQALPERRGAAATAVLLKKRDHLAYERAVLVGATAVPGLKVCLEAPMR